MMSSVKATKDEHDSEATQTSSNGSKFNYEVSRDYWSRQEASVNGMLGGYDHVSPADIEQSQKFLEHFLPSKLSKASAAARGSSNNKYEIGTQLALDWLALNFERVFQ